MIARFFILCIFQLHLLTNTNNKIVREETQI